VSIHDFVARLDRLNLPWWVARTMSWLLAVHAFATGYDYINTPEEAPQAKSLVMVERIATLHTWGIWYLLAGCVLVAGLLIVRHAIVWLGHFSLLVLYAGFAVATLQAVVKYSSSPAEAGNGPLWRAATAAFLFAGLHLLLMWARGPIPRRGEAR
jgi:hypothetical protein